MLKKTINPMITFVLLLISLGAAGTCNADGSYILVDAINTSASTDTGPWSAGNSHGFEYTPQSSYTFHRIETMFGDTRIFPVTVAVYDGRNGPLLASGSAVPTQTFIWLPFDLDAPVHFTGGVTYFIAIQPPTIDDSLPGTIAGGPTVLSWWFAFPGTLDFNTSFGSESPGFKFFIEDPMPIFADDFETGSLMAWDSSTP